MINPKDSYIRTETQAAISALLELFTPEQKEILAVKNGDIRIELIEQLVARGGNYVPITENPLILKGRAAKVIATHKHLIELIDRADKENLMSKLIDPDSHKKTSDTEFEFKKANKTSSMNESSTSGLTRILGKTLGGQSGISETYRYSQDGDMDDRKRLDAIQLKLNRVSSLRWINTETGEEDHSIEEDGSKRTEPVENVRINKEEDKGPFPLPPELTDEDRARLKEEGTSSEKKSSLVGRDKKDSRLRTSFSDVQEESKLKDLNIHEATINQSTNVTASEEAKNAFSHSDSVNRGKGTKAKKDYTIADIIYKIQSMEFVDLREQLYRKFDPFFRYDKRKSCL